jgi:hypothetical protein
MNGPTHDDARRDRPQRQRSGPEQLLEKRGDQIVERAMFAVN